jgi:hypothetical protein
MTLCVLTCQKDGSCVVFPLLISLKQLVSFFNNCHMFDSLVSFVVFCKYCCSLFIIFFYIFSRFLTPFTYLSLFLSFFFLPAFHRLQSLVFQYCDISYWHHDWFSLEMLMSLPHMLYRTVGFYPHPYYREKVLYMKYHCYTVDQTVGPAPQGGGGRSWSSWVPSCLYKEHIYLTKYGRKIKHIFW